MELHATEIIKRPLISEKTTYLSTYRHSYTFEVDRRAGKPEIRQAVESLYKVHVLDVRTIRMAGKPRRTKKGYATTPERKKAIVAIREDETIEVY